jgi:acetylglutamate kinase
MANPREKAKVLMEALPYIRSFYQKTFVIKFGGNAMIDENLKHSFAMDIVLLSYIGLRPVIVHGGGPQIGAMLNQLGKKSRFVGGMRVTDKETMDVVEMVLIGKINKEIVSLINQNGGKAIGLSGKDGNLIRARKLILSHKKKHTGAAARTIDLGLVGDVDTIYPEVIDTLDKSQFIPVIAPVGMGPDGKTYNINADLVAGEIAAALNAEKLILLTDVEGVKDRNSKLLSSITEKRVKTMLNAGTISGGMIPKVNCCIKALDNGVGKAHIIDGRIQHAILLELFTDGGIGTQLMK